MNIRKYQVLLGFSTLLTLIVSGSGQKSVDPPRVTLDFRCPSYALSGSAPIILRAEILGARELLDRETANRIKFKWQLTGGRLLSAQGTPAVKIDPAGSMTSGVIKVKLEVEGGPPELEREKTCHLKVDHKCVSPQLFDEYSAISVPEEREHLDRVAKFWKDAGPESVVYIISYMGRSACFYESQWRAASARQYLVEEHKVPRDRVVAVDGGVQESWGVHLFVQTRGACGPLPAPSLGRDIVTFTSMCSDRLK